ncbi:MAG: NAD-dependent malic enzyme [Candidatus Obscuribacterales bacterium]|nr:NAD-dependent malic enzyme [Candidatus Obscuribacterales bacterium]
MSRSSQGGRAATKEAIRPSAARNYTLTLRLKFFKGGAALGSAMSSIARGGGDTGTIDVVRAGKDFVIRDVSIALRDEAHGKTMVRRLNRLKYVEVLEVFNPVLLKHAGGKIVVLPRVSAANAADLAELYTPGVAQVCIALHADPEKAWSLSIKGNMVAIVSDGSRVLSLGNIGPYGALPVMEGKAMLFNQFAGVNAFPICLNTQNVDEIVSTVINIAPVFGAINLEDIASPGCYEVERRLQEALDIPVFHDDQHATAIAVVAAAINAAKVVGKSLSQMKVVAAGVGAAGMACIKLLMSAGVSDIVGFNQAGAVHKGRNDLSDHEKWLAESSNQAGFSGSLKEALKGADMFLGLSVGGILSGEDLKAMNKDAIVFALANPTPEVLPEQAAPFVKVMATGGSNYPNQINNALVFPGVFRGALKARVRSISEEMKMAAARALADVVSADELHADYIVPSIFDTRVAKAVSSAVIKVAIETGQARLNPDPDQF